MLTKILKSLALYKVNITGGTIHQFLRDAKWVYMGQEKRCPVYYLYLVGNKYKNAFQDIGVPIGYAYCIKNNLPVINLPEIESYINFI